MESDDERIDLGLGREDLEGMELDEPILPEIFQVHGGVAVRPHPEIGDAATVFSVPVISSKTGQPKTSKKKTPRTEAALEKRRARRRKDRKLKRIRFREEMKRRAEQAKTEQKDKDSLKNRIHYDEMVPGVLGTFYHSGTGPTPITIGNYCPSPSSNEDDHWMEEILEPEDRPWMKGYVKPTAIQRMSGPSTEPPQDAQVVERSTHNYFESPSIKLSKQAIQDKWLLLEREMKLRDLGPDMVLSQAMPKTTIADIRNILEDRQRTAGEDQDKKKALNFSYRNRKPSSDDPIIKNFIEEVHRTRVVCVNTEGTEAWDNEATKEGPRTMITFAALDGTVLFFADHRIVPTELIQMLSDPTYTKVGCGLTKEFAELERVGIHLHNWVETGALRLALYSGAWRPFTPDPTRPRLTGHTFGARRYGIEEQVCDLKYEGFLPANYARTEYSFRWNKTLKEGIIPGAMWKHVYENGRIPCAFLLLIVIDFARSRKLSEDHPAMGILHEALDLCRGRDPNDFQAQLEPSRRPQDWWLAHRGSGTPRDKMFLPAACDEMVHARNAFAFFTEPIDLEDRALVAQRVYERFFGEDPIPFPTFQEFDRDIKRALLLNRCICCGHPDHTDNCPKVPNPVCVYEHDGEDSLRPHTTEFCPVLHNYCGMCCSVGHHERVHYEKEYMKTNRELRERYFRFMTRGVYTSVPFLAFHPEGYKKLSVSHWNRCYDGTSYRRAAITRHLLGVDHEIIKKLQEKCQHQPTFKNCQRDRDGQLKMIRENIEKAKSGETIPLPRDHIETLRRKREEEERLRRKNQADKDRMRQREITVTDTVVKSSTEKNRKKRLQKKKKKQNNKL